MNLVLTPTGIKLGSKGIVANTIEKVSELLAKYPKGQARQIRKKLREGGHNNLAAAPRKAA